MIERILEKLESYNARKKRESEFRQDSRRRELEMERRRIASSKPTGIACPVCHHELGDAGGWNGAGLSPNDPPWKEHPTNHQVLCPHCGYEGWRVQYEKKPVLAEGELIDAAQEGTVKGKNR